METEVSKEDLEAWRHHPVTQAVFNSLQQQIREASHNWSVGQYLRQEPLEQAGVLGRIAAYRALIEIEIEDIQGSQNDE